jgi:arabinose-5-phosphate isomerase
MLELFQEQKKLIDGFFNGVSQSLVEEVVTAFLACQGSLVFTGVGKSGLVAQQIALTMTSLGTRAFYLSPLNAMHGDIAMVGPNDLVVIISKSGNTDELVDLLITLKSRKIATMGWFCSLNSRLAQFCDQIVLLPLEKELCPFDLSPTTSTIIQLIFGNTIAVGLMKLKSFSIDQYALNHPRGVIGKKLLLRVHDVMLKHPQLPVCRSDETLQDVLVELSDKKCGCLLITNERNELEGIFTDGDLRRVIMKQGQHAFLKKISELMSTDFLSIDKEATATEALAIMEKKNPTKKVMMLPVLEERKLLGLIRLHDIVSIGL